MGRINAHRDDYFSCRCDELGTSHFTQEEMYQMDAHIPLSYNIVALGVRAGQLLPILPFAVYARGVYTGDRHSIRPPAPRCCGICYIVKSHNAFVVAERWPIWRNLTPLSHHMRPRGQEIGPTPYDIELVSGGIAVSIARRYMFRRPNGRELDTNIPIWGRKLDTSTKPLRLYRKLITRPIDIATRISLFLVRFYYTPHLEKRSAIQH